MEIDIRRVDWKFRVPFRTSQRTRTHAQTVVLELKDGPFVGRGEAQGVSYHGETADSLADQLVAVTYSLKQGASREDVQRAMPAGGARNALDCALWDLEAKRMGYRAWRIAGMESVRPLLTAYTLSMDAPAAMGQSAVAARHYSLLKIKLSGEGDFERVAAVREACPHASLIVDANQAWNETQLHEFTRRLFPLGVKLIEQPLPAGKDEALREFTSEIPLCADESCQTTESLPSLMGKYQYVNIKLDKTGGLTEALRLANEARQAGLKLMVGCMAGSSLSMAPAFVVGQLCDVVDLDGPLLMEHDMPHAIRYDGGQMFAPEPGLWG